ncbi:MAG: hypothetical protein SFU83_05960 [Meiothermus sp.]|nr:hypothetical protein [Meiothermus sp.]
MTETERLERIQTITRFFPFWQGLKLLPIGLMCLFMAVLEGLPGDLHPAAALLLMLGAFTAGLFGYAFITAGYKKMFGAVHNPGVNRRLDFQTLFIALPLIFLSLAVDAWLNPPIFLTVLAYGVFFVWVRAATGGGRPYYLWVAAAMALVSVLPLFGLEFVNQYQTLMVVLGVSAVVVGVLDHLELTRVFKGEAQEGGAG